MTGLCSFSADNGLFTSSTTSPDWQTARGLLSRGFNQLRLAGYFPLVMDKIRVFLGEWGRWGRS
jgi:cytochrome P450